jgi:hypothetical protein
MKKLLAIAVVAGFLVPAIAGAEAGLTGKGIKLGLNMANVSGSDVSDDAEMNLGIALGGYGTWTVNEAFAVQPEIYYSQKGYSVNDVNMNLAYLDIPVLAKWTPAMAGEVKPNLYGGVSLGILLSAEVENDGDTSDIKDQVAGTDLGLVLGVGADMVISGQKFNGDIRYDMGLSKLGKEGDGKVYNSVISVLVGYGF